MQTANAAPQTWFEELLHLTLMEGFPYHFFCFFIKFIKGGGGSFPFIKIYDVNFVLDIKESYLMEKKS